MSAASLDPGAIAFLDFEASGLGEDSFPIEVGWAFLHGGSGGLLIRPAFDWTLDAWDLGAEDVHGIGWDHLQRDGRPARDVAEHLNRLLGGCALVLSDAPQQDSFWLRRLFEETPQEPSFELADERAARRGLLGDHGLAADTDAAAVGAHRAEQDACDLATVWRSLLPG